MLKWRLGVCSAVALLATVCVPVSARANSTATQHFTIAVPLTTFSTGEAGDFSNTPGSITQFNPSLGTLISVTYTLMGSITWDVKNLGSTLPETFIAGFISTNAFGSATTTGSVTVPINLSDTTTMPTGGLSAFEGTSSMFFIPSGIGFADSAGNSTNTVEATAALSGTISYNFTTTAATPLPAALPLFATGIGGLGLLGWRRKRKVKAVA
jgi:hypothetical protein